MSGGQDSWARRLSVQMVWIQKALNSMLGQIVRDNPMLTLLRPIYTLEAATTNGSANMCCNDAPAKNALRFVDFTILG